MGGFRGGLHYSPWQPKEAVWPEATLKCCLGRVQAPNMMSQTVISRLRALGGSLTRSEGKWTFEAFWLFEAVRRDARGLGMDLWCIFSGGNITIARGPAGAGTPAFRKAMVRKELRRFDRECKRNRTSFVLFRAPQTVSFRYTVSKSYT